MTELYGWRSFDDQAKYGIPSTGGGGAALITPPLEL